VHGDCPFCLKGKNPLHYFHSVLVSSLAVCLAGFICL
jgi:hypothetical protein